MKSNYILILFFFLSSFGPAVSQDNRTFETRVADALNTLPASNSEMLNNTVQDLINLGPNVVDELVRLYKESETAEQRVKMEYAFSGIGKFLSSASEGVQAQFADAFVKNVSENPFSELADALLEELALFLPDDKIEILKPLVKDRNLQMRVLDILELRPGKASGDLIWSAMNTADNRSRFKIYKILSDPAFGKQSQVLNPGMANSQTELGQLILDGLASSGDPKYQSYFASQAVDDPDPLMIDALIKYGSSLARNDHKDLAVAYFKNLSQSDNQAIQALSVYELGRVAPEEAVPDLKLALSSGVTEVAVAAVHTLPFLEDSQIKALAPSIGSAQAIARADAIRILSRRGWSGTENLIRSNLESSDTLVAAQAIIGLAEINGVQAQNEVLEFLKKATNPSVVEAGVTALKMSTNQSNINNVVGLLSTVDGEIQEALIPLVADRGGEGQFGKILELASSSTGSVQAQAIQALPKLGGSRNVEAVMGLLDGLPEDQIAVAQEALDKMMSSSEVKPWESKLQQSIEGVNQSRYIPLLGHLSGNKPMELAQKMIEAGDVSKINLLLTTAGKWAGPSMLDVILPLMENEQTYDNAYKASMGIIDRADWPDVRKILYLQKLFERTRFVTSKAELIEKIGQFRDFYSLLTVGPYLDDEASSIQNAAAKAVMNIVMPGPQNNDGMTDSLAIQYLKKAREVVRGPDSEYFKENITTYIESIPTDVPAGFVTMFDGESLDGWHGFVANPLQLERMSEQEIADKLAASNQRMRNHWWVEDGLIRFKGDGQNLVSDKLYGNFVMLVDWRIGDKGDSGIYLRGTPQVQIWDISRTDVGAEVGSGGLYNNQVHPSKPEMVADMPIGDWNHMKIAMMGEKVSVWLNGELVVDNVIMENYWDRSIPIFPTGPIELQAHGTDIAFRNIYIKEIPSGEDLLTEEEKKEGFVPLFNGFNLDGWTGNKTQYQVENGVIVVDPEASGRSGNLYTEKEYADFNFRFEFLLTPGANNGLGVRAPLSGDAAYGGVELQILDNTASIYANLKPYQYHGSLYGVAPAERGHLKPVGEWNSQEVIIKGNRYQVILNGTKILDVDARDAIKNGAMDGRDHPGLKNSKGHIGFLGHGSEVKFRNIRIKEL